jgi:hypothetical protein
MRMRLRIELKGVLKNVRKYRGKKEEEKKEKNWNSSTFLYVSYTFVNPICAFGTKHD